MHETIILLARDCEAIRIPTGDTTVLTARTPVTITQDLGGTYTVRTDEGLFRIGPKDADALGLASSAMQSVKVEARPGGTPSSAQAADEQAIWNALKTCFDPEIPVNIVDLGLVYDVHLAADPGGGSTVDVKMTLTAPGCGMGPVIARDAQNKILTVPGVASAAVEIVWDPPWHQSMISVEGRRALGLE